MRKVIATLKSVSPYSQGRFHETEKLNDSEQPGDYEKRTWKNKCHVGDDGNVFIPPMAFKNCLTEAGTYLSVKVVGKGNNTYAKYFKTGVMVMDPVPLGIAIDDVQCEVLFVPSNGVRGTGKRVKKWFPVIPQWEATVTFYILEDMITEDIFAEHLDKAGKFIGVGRFRPLNNGYYGRFEVIKIEWE